MTRTLIYFIYHPQGRIDAYIPHMLAALRPRFNHIHVVFNGCLTPAATAQLHMADTIQERPNIEFDVGAYRAAINALPGNGLGGIEELTLANFTFFGPLNDMQHIWDWADTQEVDFWGLSAHAALDHNPFGEGALPYHLNSHWITIRAPMLHSAAFVDWWKDMPKIESYADSVLHHESRFTAHFASLGYRHAAYLDPEDGAAYPAFDEAHTHIAQGFPILKRRLFYHTPTAYNDWHEVNPRKAVEAIAKKSSYDLNMIWQSVAGAADPWVLYQNADLLFVMDDIAQSAAEFPAPIFLLHIPEPLQAEDLRALSDALTTPVQLRLCGDHSKSVRKHLLDHPMVRSITQFDAAELQNTFLPDTPVLIGHLLPGGGKAMAHGFSHLARNAAIAAQAQAKINETTVFGLAFPPVQTHGPNAHADAPLKHNEHPILGQDANIAWARTELANEIAKAWPAPEKWVQIAAENGLISIVISNCHELPRSFVKLEARYRALAGQLDVRGPFEAPARLAHHIAYPTSPAAKSAWEKAATTAHDAGHKIGFDAGYEQGYAAAHRPAFDDGYQQGFEAGRAKALTEISEPIKAADTQLRILRWRE